MTKDQIIEYLIKNEQTRYEAEKEAEKSFRFIISTLIICLTAVACFYIYFGMPSEEVIYDVDNGSQIVAESSISGDNNNGR